MVLGVSELCNSEIKTSPVLCTVTPSPSVGSDISDDTYSSYMYMYILLLLLFQCMYSYM